MRFSSSTGLYTINIQVAKKALAFTHIAYQACHCLRPVPPLVCAVRSLYGMQQAVTCSGSNSHSFFRSLSHPACIHSFVCMYVCSFVSVLSCILSFRFSCLPAFVSFLSMRLPKGQVHTALTSFLSENLFWQSE